MERWRDGERASLATLFDHGFIVQLLHLAEASRWRAASREPVMDSQALDDRVRPAAKRQVFLFEKKQRKQKQARRIERERNKAQRKEHKQKRERDSSSRLIQREKE